MRHQTEKQAAAFKAKATKALVALGATPGEGMYGFKLNTIHGMLHIAPYGEAIRTRFNDIPVSPPAGAPLNRYSGKWNFEFGLHPTDEELEQAIASIKAILPGPSPDAELIARLQQDQRDLIASLKAVTFIAETVAHLQGKERDILPTTDKARELIARVEAS